MYELGFVALSSFAILFVEEQLASASADKLARATS
jgi:hypothetical protein